MVALHASGFDHIRLPRPCGIENRTIAKRKFLSSVISRTGLSHCASIADASSHDHAWPTRPFLAPMPKRKHVGLVVESLEACGGRVLDGIARWLHTNPGWRMAVFDGGRHELAQLARDWEGDGMVCTTPNPELQVALESLNIPSGNV